MKLSNKALKEFQKIYKQEYGRKVKFHQAKQLALNLLRFTNEIYKPIPK